MKQEGNSVSSAQKMARLRHVLMQREISHSSVDLFDLKQRIMVMLRTTHSTCHMSFSNFPVLYLVTPLALFTPQISNSMSGTFQRADVTDSLPTIKSQLHACRVVRVPE